MKKSLIRLTMVLFFALLLCFTFSCQPQAEEPAEEAKPVVDTAADVEAIKSMAADIMKGFNAGDYETYLAYMADDIVWMPPGEATIMGKEAVRNWFMADSGVSYRVNITVDEVKILGDWAVERETWVGGWTHAESGEAGEFDNKSIHVIQRHTDGAWKITYAIWNANPKPEQE